ncbi:TetR/AcrR family transcriptional regulator [Conexibacter sp. SYSU D00693]|uniref:TetR/AcrR family transcriptional regulator n=1 Tax=Conexibacter sp. SYSU D00693 TaxID=2812560 RepID=UPI00196B33BA|nr:TetR/AcrR family transcriptional regulator [Conexibacter sp. SYSU D00693]
MPATVPPSRQGRAYRREEIEQLLRDALAELMADGTPFRDVSVERLVRRAGMARSTFYLHFEDKRAMLEALSAAALHRLYRAQRSWIAKGRDVTVQDVRDGMRALLEVFGEEEVVLRAVAEASASDAALRAAYAGGVEDYARAMERVIRKGQKEGWVRDVPPAETAAALAWMTERTVSQLAPGASRRRITATADALAVVVCATLLVAHGG